MAATATMERKVRNASKDEAFDLRVRKAAARYLGLQGYEVIEHDWRDDGVEVDLVCKDADGTLVFVDVESSEGDFPAQERIRARRSQLEVMALAYLAEYEAVDIPVRFDSVCVVPVGEDRALLRHTVNVLGTE